MVHPPNEQAWNLLKAGAESTNAETRRIAIGALGIIVKNRQAAAIAENGLSDDNSDVRIAAATALGQMDSHASIPKLLSALDDKEPAVVLAAAQSLVRLKNERGYDIYYEVLTGERRGSKGSVAKEIETLKNPKKLAELGFEEGIGFVPFGGMGLETLRVLRGDSNSAIRAAAAKVLVHDSDPDAEKALTDAVTDKSWHVRVAAVDAIAERNDPKLLAPVETAMQDDKDAVKYSAAAAVVHLLDIERRHVTKPRKTKSSRAKPVSQLLQSKKKTQDVSTPVSRARPNERKERARRAPGSAREPSSAQHDSVSAVNAGIVESALGSPDQAELAISR